LEPFILEFANPVVADEDAHVADSAVLTTRAPRLLPKSPQKICNLNVSPRRTPMSLAGNATLYQIGVSPQRDLEQINQTINRGRQTSRRQLFQYVDVPPNSSDDEVSLDSPKKKRKLDDERK